MLSASAALRSLSASSVWLLVFCKLFWVLGFDGLGRASFLLALDLMDLMSTVVLCMLRSSRAVALGFPVSLLPADA